MYLAIFDGACDAADDVRDPTRSLTRRQGKIDLGVYMAANMMGGVAGEVEEIVVVYIVDGGSSWVVLEMGSARSRSEDLAAAGMRRSFFEAAAVHMADLVSPLRWVHKAVVDGVVAGPEHLGWIADMEDRRRWGATTPSVAVVVAARGM